MSEHSPWQHSAENLTRRRRISKIFKYTCISMTVSALVLVAVLILQVFSQGLSPYDYEATPFIVSNENTFVDALTMDQLQAIFSAEGSARKWSDLNSNWPDEYIKIYGFQREYDENAHKFITEKITGDRDGSLKQKDATYFEYPPQVMNALLDSPYAIAYVDPHTYSRNRSRVKALSLDGVAYTPENADSEAYPVTEEKFIFVDWDFLTSPPSSHDAGETGVYIPLIGTLWLVALTALISVPLAIGSAIYLEEYAKQGRISTFIEINISNLAGVPSIVYGILGLAVFYRTFGLGNSVITGALTLSLLILPVVITASREAIRAVPQSLRHAALALGSNRWQAIWYHVLPSALPGVMTGIILSLSRAIGETAPLIIVGAAISVTSAPGGPMSQYSILPLSIYEWSDRQEPGFAEAAAAAIVVLLVVLLLLNGIAIFIRNRYQNKLS